MYNDSRTGYQVIAVLVMLTVVAASGFCAPKVMLNDQPVTDGEMLVVIQNSLLLPARVMFDALGAQTSYEPDQQHKITATRDSKVLVMWLGSQLATLDDVPLDFETTPTRVRKTNYVPVRDVVEAFGGTVTYDRVNETALITLAAGGVTPPPPAGETKTVEGVVLQIFRTDPIQMLLRNKATNQTELLALVAGCQVLQEQAGQAVTAAQVSDIKAGDQLVVNLVEGIAHNILIKMAGSASDPTTPDLQHMRVELVGVTGKYLLLPGNNSLLVADNASILDQYGQAIALNALGPKDRVLIIVDTAHNFAVRVVREASGGAVAQDTTPPTFIGITPAHNTTVTDHDPKVRARFRDAESGINKAATTMIFDYQDVTAQCELGDDYVEYLSHNLADGFHSVDVTILDRAGNANRNQWGFVVQSPAGKEILSVTHNATAALTVGEVVQITVQVARPGGEMNWDIGTWKKGLQANRMADTNFYTGLYQVQHGDAATGKLKAHYRPPGGTWSEAESATAVTIGAKIPGAVKVTQPTEDSVVGDTMVVAGTAPADHRVRVKVHYNKQRFIDLSQDLPEQIVDVAANGTWKTEAFQTDLGLLGKADTYDIRAELLGKDSDAVIAVKTLTVKGK
jgi:hypothetical protein